MATQTRGPRKAASKRPTGKPRTSRPARTTRPQRSRGPGFWFTLVTFLGKLAGVCKATRSAYRSGKGAVRPTSSSTQRPGQRPGPRPGTARGGPGTQPAAGARGGGGWQPVDGRPVDRAPDHSYPARPAGGAGSGWRSGGYPDPTDREWVDDSLTNPAAAETDDQADDQADDQDGGFDDPSGGDVSGAAAGAV